LLPAVSGVLPVRRERTGAPADRRRERPGQRTFQVRAPRHGDAADAGVEDRRPAVAVPDRLAGREQRRSGQDGTAHPQPHVRAGRCDQRLRGRLEPSADLRGEPGRRRILQHYLYDQWHRNPGDPSDVPPDDVRARVEKQYLVTVWDDLEIWRYQKYVENPALSRVDAKPYMALRKWAQQFYEVAPIGAPAGLP